MNCTCLAQKISALQIQGHKFKAGTVSIRQSAMITRIHWSKMFFSFLTFISAQGKDAVSKILPSISV